MTKQDFNFSEDFYKKFNDFISEFYIKADEIGATRPTAVNLLWAVKKMKEKASNFVGDIDELKIALLSLANELKEDDLDRCHSLSLYGSDLIPHASNVITTVSYTHLTLPTLLLV